MNRTTTNAVTALRQKLAQLDLPASVDTVAAQKSTAAATPTPVQVTAPSLIISACSKSSGCNAAKPAYQMPTWGRGLAFLRCYVLPSLVIMAFAVLVMHVTAPSFVSVIKFNKHTGNAENTVCPFRLAIASVVVFTISFVLLFFAMKCLGSSLRV
jgi:hypothetical protein